MYQLTVYFPPDKTPRATMSAARAADVLELIPKLLAEHEGCERILVTLNGNKLFAVDCHGNTVP